MNMTMKYIVASDKIVVEVLESVPGEIDLLHPSKRCKIVQLASDIKYNKLFNTTFNKGDIVIVKYFRTSILIDKSIFAINPEEIKAIIL